MSRADLVTAADLAAARKRREALDQQDVRTLQLWNDTLCGLVTPGPVFTKFGYEIPDDAEVKIDESSIAHVRENIKKSIKTYDSTKIEVYSGPHTAFVDRQKYNQERSKRMEERERALLNVTYDHIILQTIQQFLCQQTYNALIAQSDNNQMIRKYQPIKDTDNLTDYDSTLQADGELHQFLIAAWKAASTNFKIKSGRVNEHEKLKLGNMLRAILGLDTLDSLSQGQFQLLPVQIVSQSAAVYVYSHSPWIRHQKQIQQKYRQMDQAELTAWFEGVIKKIMSFNHVAGILGAMNNIFRDDQETVTQWENHQQEALEIYHTRKQKAIEAYKEMALKWLTQQGTPEPEQIVKQIIDSGISEISPDSYRFQEGDYRNLTFLHIAIRQYATAIMPLEKQYYNQIVQYLIAHGHSLSTVTNEDLTPCQYASKLTNKEVNPLPEWLAATAGNVVTTSSKAQQSLLQQTKGQLTYHLGVLKGGIWGLLGSIYFYFKNDQRDPALNAIAHNFAVIQDAVTTGSDSEVQQRLALKSSLFMLPPITASSEQQRLLPSSSSHPTTSYSLF